MTSELVGCESWEELKLSRAGLKKQVECETADKLKALRGSALGKGAARGSWDLIGVIRSYVCSGKNLLS